MLKTAKEVRVGDYVAFKYEHSTSAPASRNSYKKVIRRTVVANNRNHIGLVMLGVSDGLTYTKNFLNGDLFYVWEEPKKEANGMKVFEVLDESGNSLFKEMAAEIRFASKESDVVQFMGYSGHCSRPDVILSAYKMKPGDFVFESISKAEFDKEPNT